MSSSGADAGTVAALLEAICGPAETNSQPVE
jgi:hypothetical protein